MSAKIEPSATNPGRKADKEISVSKRELPRWCRDAIRYLVLRISVDWVLEHMKLFLENLSI